MVLETVWREVSTVQVTGCGYWLEKEGMGGGKDDPWASRLWKVDGYQLPVWEAERRVGIWRADSRFRFGCARVRVQCRPIEWVWALTGPNKGSLSLTDLFFSVVQMRICTGKMQNLNWNIPEG